MTERRRYSAETAHIQGAKDFLAELWVRAGWHRDVITQDADGNDIVMSQERYEQRERNNQPNGGPNAGGNTP